jgi:hypothetical protein
VRAANLSLICGGAADFSGILVNLECLDLIIEDDDVI